MEQVVRGGKDGPVVLTTLFKNFPLHLRFLYLRFKEVERRGKKWLARLKVREGNGVRLGNWDWEGVWEWNDVLELLGDWRIGRLKREWESGNEKEGDKWGFGDIFGCNS